MKQRRATVRVVFLATCFVGSSCAAPPQPARNERGPDASVASGAPEGERPVEPSCVCSLSEAELASREEWLASFAAGVEVVSDLTDGMEYRFPSTWGARLLELIEKECACCTSIAFELRFEPEGGPILLRCRGEREATEFLRARIANPTAQRPGERPSVSASDRRLHPSFGAG